MADTARPSDLAGDFRGWDRLRRPVWIFDPVSCRGVYANPPALALWGAADLDELLARDFSQLSPAVRARTDRLATTTAAGETVTERWTFYPKGVPTTVQAAISTIDLGDGRSALLFEASPVTVADEELRAVEALRHTSTMIGLFDAEGRAVFSNPAAFAAFGEDRSRFADRFPDPQEGGAVLRSVLDGTVLAALRQVRTKQGERYHHLDARAVLDPVSGAPAVLLSERDVTAQVEAEEALFVARERAELAESKQRFLSNMSHELRTPLTSVLGFASLLAASDLDADQALHVGRIADAGESLLVHINDVITMSELDSGRITLAPRTFDPVELVWDALKSIETAAVAKGLDAGPRCGGRHAPGSDRRRRPAAAGDRPLPLQRPEVHRCRRPRRIHRRDGGRLIGRRWRCRCATPAPASPVLLRRNFSAASPWRTTVCPSGSRAAVWAWPSARRSWP